MIAWRASGTSAHEHFSQRRNQRPWSLALINRMTVILFLLIKNGCFANEW